MSTGSPDDGLNELEMCDQANDIVLLNSTQRVTDMDDRPANFNELEESMGSSSSGPDISRPAEPQNGDPGHSCTMGVLPRSDLPEFRHRITDSGPKVVEKCPMKEEARSLIFWRKPVRSGIVLAVLLAFQFSFVYLSAISVVAYAGLLLFASTNFYRLYYQYIAKSESKLMKEYIEREISLPEDRIADVSRRLTDMLNRWIAQAREIFLLTNIAASVKFGVLLYLMTYVGARFNFLTLCILGTVLVFSVPKFYESYQREIDHAWDIVREKLDKVVSLMNSQLDKVPVLGSRKQKAQ